MATKWKRIALNVPERLYERIKAEAERKHLNVTSILKLGIGEWLDQQQRERGEILETGSPRTKE